MKKLFAIISLTLALTACVNPNTGEKTNTTTGTYRVEWGHTESKTEAEGGGEV